MKTTTQTLIFSFISLIANYANATQTCENYITDEWKNDRYTISDDNKTVIDKVTNLMWKRCSEGLSGDNCETGTIATMNWQVALNRVKTVNDSNFAGYNNWRLPNIEQLRSIVAYNCRNPSINESAFPTKTPASNFFSSSPDHHSPGSVWGVNFLGSIDGVYVNSSSNMVRLVRDAK